MQKKPVKKTDSELYRLIDAKIESGCYVFLRHARERQNERAISDLDVLNILTGKSGLNRKRNKEKDHYEDGRQDWNYCIEGTDLDERKIRIIVSFFDDYMPIITVIRINR